MVLERAVALSLESQGIARAVSSPADLDRALQVALRAADTSRKEEAAETQLRAAARALQLPYHGPVARAAAALQADDQLQVIEFGSRGSSEEEQVQAAMARQAGFCIGGEHFARGRLDQMRARRAVDVEAREQARLRQERRQKRSQSAASRSSA